MRLNSDEYDIKDYISFKEKPKWWNRLPVFTNNMNTISEMISKIGLENIGTNFHTSAKICPSFNNLFRNSLLIKSPAEMYIELTNESCTWISSNELISISAHPGPQLPKRFEENYYYLKFQLPILFAMNKSNSMVIQNPTLYNEVDYNVCPNLTYIPKNTAQEVNIIAFFKKPKNNQKIVHHIKCDQVLGLYTFTHPADNFVEKNLLSKPFNAIRQRKSFLGTWNKIGLHK